MAFPTLSQVPILTTDRLELHPLSLADQQEIFELHQDEKVLQYIERPKATSVEDALAFINKINGGIKENKWCYWKICLKKDPTLIGTICLWMFNEDGTSCDIGYELRTAFLRKGYMREATAAIINYGFETLNLNSIQAYTHQDNAPSTRLLKYFEFKLSERDNENLIFVKAKKS